MSMDAAVKTKFHWREYKSAAEVEAQVRATGQQLFVREGSVYDLQEFLEVYKHPGGARIVQREVGTDIGAKMSDNGHSANAYELLELYKVGYIKGLEAAAPIERRATNERLKSLGIDPSNLSSVMQKLDLDKPILGQIWGADMKYEEYMAFIHDPKVINKSPRIFVSDFMEFFTKTPWFVIPMFWLPIVMLQVWAGSNPQRGVAWHALLFLAGLFYWTFFEYIFHRFVFHLLENHRLEGKFLRSFHFLFHGIHHAYPLDEYRLVFPIVPCIVVASGAYLATFWVFGYEKYTLVINGGFLFGYTVYDCIHYFLHHVSKENIFLNFQKRYHNKHHYRQPDMGFGVSTPLWDYVFRTVLN